jgi:hypothetical protein
MKRKNLAIINLTDVEKPKLDFVSKKNMLSDLRDFKHGQRVWVEVSTYYRKRSVEQNAVLHWYLSEISEETGMGMEDVKSQMAKKYLTVPQVDKNDQEVADPETGELMTRVKSTTELSTVQFNDYTEQIREWANSYLNLQLPLPNEDVELKFKENY